MTEWTAEIKFPDGTVMTRTGDSSTYIYGLKHKGKRPTVIHVTGTAYDRLMKACLYAVHPVQGKVYLNGTEFGEYEEVLDD